MQVSEAPQHVKDELLDNETITWIGQPSTKYAIVASVPFLLFAGFIAFGSIKELLDSIVRHLPLPFSLFNCIGLLFACFVLSTPLKLWFQARSTYYVVTDKRIVIVSGGKNRKVEQYDKKTLKPMMSMSFLGFTNLCWTAPGTHKDSDGDTKSNTVTFFGIQPREVYNISSEPFPKISEMSRTLPK